VDQDGGQLTPICARSSKPDARRTGDLRNNVTDVLHRAEAGEESTIIARWATGRPAPLGRLSPSDGIRTLSVRAKRHKGWSMIVPFAP
jgi:antitoxin (DNA-binding transcriptional repressor) of toxin-antitoxin stability system